MRRFERLAYTEKADRIIFILTDQQTHEFYIGQCKEKDIRNNYTRHILHIVKSSEKLFENTTKKVVKKASENDLKNTPKNDEILGQILGQNSGQNDTEIEVKFVCYFQLEKFNDTKVNGFKKIIAWSKYLIENGYKIINKGELVNYTNDLYKDTEQLYLQIKDTKIENIICCQNCMVKKYKFQICPIWINKNKVGESV